MSCETCGTSIDFCDSCSTCHICLEEDRQRLTTELAKKSDLYAGVKALCEQQIEQNQRLRDEVEALKFTIDSRDNDVENLNFKLKRLMDALEEIAWSDDCASDVARRALEGEGECKHRYTLPLNVHSYCVDCNRRYEGEGE